MRVYTLRSRSLNYHNLPFFEESDLSAINRIRNVVLTNSDLSLAINLPDLELCCHGDFDAEKGFKCGKPRVVLSLEDLKGLDDLQSAWRAKNEIQNVAEQT